MIQVRINGGLWQKSFLQGPGDFSSEQDRANAANRVQIGNDRSYKPEYRVISDSIEDASTKLRDELLAATRF